MAKDNIKWPSFVEKNTLSPFLKGFSSKDIPWTPFVVMGIILSISVAIAINSSSSTSASYIVAGVIGAVLTILVIQYPEIGAYLLIISVFSNLSDLLSDRGLPGINRPLIALTSLSLLINYSLKTGKFSRLPSITRVEWMLLCLYLVIVASVFVSFNEAKSFKVLIDITKDILTGIIVFACLNTREKWEKGAWSLISVITFLSILGVIKVAVGIDQEWDFAQLSAFGQVGEANDLRYAGPLGESNIWGQVLVAIIPLILYRIKFANGSQRKLILGGSALIIFLAVIYTSSRGAIVALAAVAPFILRDLRVKPIAIVIGMGVLSLLLVVLPASYTQRYLTLGVFFNEGSSPTDDESVNARTSSMLTGLGMFQQNPFLGVGFGNYGANYWQYAGELGLTGIEMPSEEEDSEIYAHSLYVEILSEMGIFGFAAFCAFFYFLFKGLFDAKKQFMAITYLIDWSSWMAAIFMALLTFLVGAIFLHGIFFRFIWILIGMAQAGIAISNNTPKPVLSTRKAILHDQ